MKNEEMTFETVKKEIPVKYLDLNLSNISNSLSETNYNGLCPEEVLNYSTIIQLVADLIRIDKRLAELCTSKDEELIRERNNAFEVLKIKKLDLIKVISNL
jgi:hypothetical protein